MFRKILIANRGEIAVRVISACRELAIRTVAVHSDVDAAAPHVRLADEAVCIGPAAPLRSYLNVPAVVSAVTITGADAVHPGYGFLAESGPFAEAVARAGATFIGPSAETLQLVGDKVRARAVMQDAGLSVLPGTDEPPPDVDRAVDAAEGLGYPVMVKAAAGGGGKGMRLVRDAGELRASWATAEREALSSAGDGTLYLERHLSPARHVEVQILADQAGGVVHLGERECSIQRRHQKLMEEAPSVVMTAERRAEWGRQVTEAARRVGYQGAGTFEFLVDRAGDACFLEVNPRLQVEHPVTEMVTGVDIVKEQIRIASGAPLSLDQTEVVVRGHAVECRIVAESPRTFRPSSGTIRGLRLPGGPGVRVDSGITWGDVVSPHYDSLLAKVITWGRDRAESLARMRRALAMTTIEGVETSVSLQRRILNDPELAAGRLSTSFLERYDLS